MCLLYVMYTIEGIDKFELALFGIHVSATLFFSISSHNRNLTWPLPEKSHLQFA